MPILDIQLKFEYEQVRLNPHPLKLTNPTLDTLDKAICALYSLCKNARNICLRNVPLTDDSICQLLQNGATYRVYFTFQNVEIYLHSPTLANLDTAILGILGRQNNFTNARNIFFRNILLTDDSICQLLKDGAVYKAYFTKPFEDCPNLCDVYLFEHTI